MTSICSRANRRERNQASLLGDAELDYVDRFAVQEISCVTLLYTCLQSSCTNPWVVASISSSVEMETHLGCLQGGKLHSVLFHVSVLLQHLFKSALCDWLTIVIGGWLGVTQQHILWKSSVRWKGNCRNTTYNIRTEVSAMRAHETDRQRPQHPRLI